MRISRLAFAMFGLWAIMTPAGAFELGQLVSGTRVGEPLAARIELYGLDAAEAAALSLELKPLIGSAAAPALAALDARIVSDADGQPYIAFDGNQPLAEPVLEFRLRAASGDVARTRHYTLLLAAPAPRVAASPVRARSASPASRPAVAAQAPTPATMTAGGAGGEYGPVRAGQSLWQILQENGLARGDTAATIASIVSANPHAFVAGSADRLKVGVMLALPAAETSVRADAAAMAAPVAATPPAPAALSAPAVEPALTASPSPVTSATVAAADQVQVPVQAIDSDTRARLRALEEKFAAIRARYAAQEARVTQPAQPSATVTMSPASAPESAPSADAASAPVAEASEAARPDAPAPVLPLLAIVSVLALAAVLGGGMLARRWRRSGRRAHTALAAADRSLIQEITAKAEKRVQLEDEVKRALRNRDGNGEAPAPIRSDPKPALEEAPMDFSSTIERLADLENSTVGFEEIETRIAYGQYREAERLLSDVLAKAPRNHRAKLRLAEIYYLDERHDEFVELAGEIHRLHRADIDDDDWQRIMRMGKVIAPERPPFSGPLAIDTQRDAG